MVFVHVSRCLIFKVQPRRGPVFRNPCLASASIYYHAIQKMSSTFFAFFQSFFHVFFASICCVSPPALRQHAGCFTARSSRGCRLAGRLPALRMSVSRGAHCAPLRRRVCLADGRVPSLRAGAFRGAPVCAATEAGSPRGRQSATPTGGRVCGETAGCPLASLPRTPPPTGSDP